MNTHNILLATKSNKLTFLSSVAIANYNFFIIGTQATLTTEPETLTSVANVFFFTFKTLTIQLVPPKARNTSSGLNSISTANSGSVF